MKHIPNCITAFRAMGAILLLFLKPFTPEFYVVYSVCGVSDAVDGFIARSLKSESAWGAKLDSISDLLFYSAMLVRIVPYLWGKIFTGIWYFAAVIFIIRFASYTVAAVKYRQLAAVHTYFNKLTGVAVFSVPYLIKWVNMSAVCLSVCIIGFIASSEELAIHIISKKYRTNVKSIFLINRKIAE